METYNTYPFKLMPLPYKYDALEPEIDTRTVEIHHNKHLKAYVDNLNNILKDYPDYQHWTLEQLVTYTAELPEAIRQGVRNNGGGVYNHNFYFSLMNPNGSNVPVGNLKATIEKQFGSWEKCRKQLKETAAAVFGSGYAWLVLNGHGDLEIVKTPNQDTVLTAGACPLLGIDVWEHAYYLKYQNRRPDYIENWMNLINWNFAENCYKDCLKASLV